MSVPVISWPADVPSCIFPTTPQGGLQDNRVSFEPDVGNAIERPKSTWTPEVYSVELVPMTVDQFKTFQRWYKQDLRFGVYPFEFLHPITRDLGAWKIVRGNPPYQVRKPRLNHSGNVRCIYLSFTVTSFPLNVPPWFLLQENGDYVLQENGGRIIVRDGVEFDATA